MVITLTFAAFEALSVVAPALNSEALALYKQAAYYALRTCRSLRIYVYWVLGSLKTSTKLLKIHQSLIK